MIVSSQHAAWQHFVLHTQRSIRRTAAWSNITYCAALFLALLILLAVGGIVAQAQDTNPRPHRDSHPKVEIIDTSNAKYTITFSSCRENAKQHVSCQWTDKSGKQHWVYLAGLGFADSK